MKKNKYIISILFVLFLSLFVVSCDNEITLNETTDQLFRPALFSASINGNEVTFSWVPIANATYSLEISKDSLLFETDLQVIPLDKITTSVVGDLWSQSRYSARIKAISTDSAVKDSEYNQITFKTGTENTFYALTDDDIGFNSVLLTWDNSKDVDKIVVSTAESDDVTVPLTSEDKSAGKKLIENLNPGTHYDFKIYLGEMLRGSVSVTTNVSFTQVEVDETQTGGAWVELGTYYFLANAGTYVQIRNDNTTGIIIADAFKFSKEGYEDIIVDNTDSSVTTVGSWNTSSSSSHRIGENYFYNTDKSISSSIKYAPNLPASGRWTLYMFWNGNSTRASNIPVDIFAGE